MAFTHAADDITLGRGELYFFPFLAGTVPGRPVAVAAEPTIPAENMR